MIRLNIILGHIGRCIGPKVYQGLHSSLTNSNQRGQDMYGKGMSSCSIEVRRN